MRISTNWLRDYVETGLSAEELGDLLTMSGLELEEIERVGADLSGVVVGHVLETSQHPNADRLTLCKVDVGEGEPLQIVCGAPNVAGGQKVPVATVGTTLMLPSREDPSERVAVKIKKSKLRGEVSQGMICAEDELGLGDEHDGILVLDDSAEIGQPFGEYLEATGQSKSDAVLDLAITPNRPDATSHIGVARDLAALTKQPLKLPEVALVEEGGEAAEQISVEIKDPEGCPRYVGMMIRGVKVGPSPDWLRGRLEAIGLRPINNVVDVTNFVLHEVGQPLHAFDYDLVAGRKIIVRRSVKGETITTLDGEERKLPEGTLLICDAEKPVAVAGVIGGASSEVSEATTNLLLESAYFEPVSIRKAAKALGLQTDASYRFERGVDPTGQARAAMRAAELIVEIAGGEIVPGFVDAHPTPHTPLAVNLRPERVAKVLGIEVPIDDITRLLTAIGFEVEDGEGGLRCTIPPFRPDIEREIDVIEEIARLWGFGRIPSPATTPVPLVPAGDTPEAKLLNAVRMRFVGLGFRELYTNSLVPKETAEQFAGASWTGVDAEIVETLNPISQDMSAMRPSLLPGLLGVVAYNQARGAESLRLMEFGHVYTRSTDPSDPPAGAGQAVKGYHEHTSLILGITGSVEEKGWNTEARAADFFDLKGTLEHVLGALDLPEITETPSTEPDALTAYRLVLHVGEKRLGVIARVSHELAEIHDLRAPLFVAELNADLLAELAHRDGNLRYKPISRFPAVDRDLAVAVGDDQPVGPMLATVRQTAGPLLQSVRVFDLYRGGRVEGGQKSVAFALRFLANRTLRDEEVDGRIRKVVKALEREYGAQLRA